MAWCERLREASFRGATFKAASHSADPAGRRVSGTFATAARTFNADIGMLIRTPATFASRLTGFASSTIAETGGGRAGITALAPLTTFGEQLPSIARLIEVAAEATEPALVTAYRLYGDASRGDEIAARNRLRHPGFVPGGSPLEVLSQSGGVDV